MGNAELYEKLIEFVFTSHTTALHRAQVDTYRNVEQLHQHVFSLSTQTDSATIREYKKAFSLVRLYVRNALIAATGKLKALLSKGDTVMIRTYIEELDYSFYDKTRLDEIIRLSYGCLILYSL